MGVAYPRMDVDKQTMGAQRRGADQRDAQQQCGRLVPLRGEAEPAFVRAAFAAAGWRSRRSRHQVQ
ncbi:hypothetical protein [Streptomyces sp. NPDC058674]|uniref:hypothetical protein n=1 Tax=Streptomyces sp. NPDC058674 TaxID=3346592 RepID=UPI00365BE6C4